MNRQMDDALQRFNVTAQAPPRKQLHRHVTFSPNLPTRASPERQTEHRFLPINGPSTKINDWDSDTEGAAGSRVSPVQEHPTAPSTLLVLRKKPLVHIQPLSEPLRRPHSQGPPNPDQSKKGPFFQDERHRRSTLLRPAAASQI